MVTKDTKKKTTKANRTAKKISTSPSVLLKKVASVSDSNKTLQKEIRSMSKIFTENQKVLISMKGMIDTLTSTLENIQKQSKQINIIEEDTQKLYAGLNQVRSQSNIINKINDQTEKLQDEINKISKIQKVTNSTDIPQQVEDSINSIRNNSQMIIKIAQRIDEVREDLRKVSGKTDSVIEIGSEIDKLKESIEEVSTKTTKLEVGTQIITSLKQELERIAESVSTSQNLDAELSAIKITINSISSKAEKINSLGGVIEGLKQQFDAIEEKARTADNLSVESIKGLAGKMDKIEATMGTLSQRTDATAFVGEEIKSVQIDFSKFKENMFDKTDIIEEKIKMVSDTLEKQDTVDIEFHKKSNKLFDEIQNVKNIANKTSNDSSKEMMALLKLSEYQSTVRMNTESKYGDVKTLEKIGKQTVDISNLFDNISTELGEKIPLPNEVRQWAVSKILDCADKWEIRFSDAYSILTNTIGRDKLKEIIRIQQIRDIYGIRAVDEIRKDLNIS